MKIISKIAVALNGHLLIAVDFVCDLIWLLKAGLTVYKNSGQRYGLNPTYTKIVGRDRYMASTQHKLKS